MRKLFSTTMDVNITAEFKKKCKEKGYDMNDVLESIMVEFIKGNLILERQGKYSIKKK